MLKAINPFRMKLMKHIVVAILAFAFLGVNIGKAQTKLTTDELLGQINTITTAVPFLMIAPDSRAGGLGDAGVASTPDANSMHWNPAKYAFIKDLKDGKEKKLGVSISYIPWLRQLVPEINLAYLSGYYRIDADQVIAASLRYFSLGNIVFTNIVGDNIGQFNPNEFALDFAYSRKLSDRFSASMAARYIYSNLTGGIDVQGSATRAGKSFATDLSAYYENDDIDLGDKGATLGIGLNISNVGAKIAYSDRGGVRDFIPINLKTGASLNIDLDEHNRFGIIADINKLLVPSPPVYDINSDGSPKQDADGNYVILKGKDPNRGIASGMVGSFSDAPGGFKEELREFNLGGGFEYWYDNQFAVRAGYFHEHATKGNRKFITLGAGLKYNVFSLDFAYLIPTQQRNPLENTLRFTLLFNFDDFNEQNNGG